MPLRRSHLVVLHEPPKTRGAAESRRRDSPSRPSISAVVVVPVAVAVAVVAVDIVAV